MSDWNQTMLRYLLGELPEGERSALEEQYFADPRVFEEVTRAETALVDDYVRGRLPVEMRQRFEQAYLADPRRRERVKFAEALVERVDRAGVEPSAQGVRPPLALEQGSGSGSWGWFGALWLPKPALAFGVAALLIVSTGIWLAIDARRAREEAAQADARQTELERLAREAEIAERVRTSEMEAQLPRPVDQPPPATGPAPQEPRVPSFVTLALAVGLGERSAEANIPPTLVIPPGTSDVHLQLTLREHEYATYQVVLRAIGGAEILRRADIQPSTGASGAVVTLSVPASRFVGGDYMLTFQGMIGSGELDDLSQSLFRVDKK
jgi:anti-sigma factor RsiW